MTVAELIAELQKVVQSGGSERLVRMGDARTSDYAEVTGLWIPTDEAVVDLESAEWRPPAGSVVLIALCDCDAADNPDPEMHASDCRGRQELEKG